MKRITIGLSTLVVLHLIGAVLLGLNVRGAFSGQNEFILPLGWPNDAVYLYLETFHAWRADQGLPYSWGSVRGYGLAVNLLMFFSALAIPYVILERKRLGLNAPHRNTRWLLAGVLSLLIAANICERSDSFLDPLPGFGNGYGLPFIGYSRQRAFTSYISNDPDEYDSPYYTYKGWNPGHCAANAAVAGWVLFLTYLLSERIQRSPVPAPRTATPPASAGP